MPGGVYRRKLERSMAGEREMREAMQGWKDDGKVKGHLLQKEIKWEFNPPAASHMGGIWERQIRTVRKVLNVILKEQTLDDERLSTLFCEVESIVNGRPLTVLSDDAKPFAATSWRARTSSGPV